MTKQIELLDIQNRVQSERTFSCQKKEETKNDENRFAWTNIIYPFCTRVYRLCGCLHTLYNTHTHVYTKINECHQMPSFPFPSTQSLATHSLAMTSAPSNVNVEAQSICL